MKLILKDGCRYILRFEYAEEFILQLKNFCDKEGIGAGFFMGLGAASEVNLHVYDLKTKKYSKRNFEETLEVANLTGNISKKEGETIIHAHGSFGRANLQARVGHVSKLIVGATLEVHLVRLDGEIERKLDEKIGLNLME